MKNTFSICCIVISMLTFLSCSTKGKITYDSRAQHKLISELTGLSAMSKVDDDNYLLVHDTKNFQSVDESKIPHAQVSLFSFGLDKFPILQKIVFPSWKTIDQFPNDLESICKLEKRKNEYLLIEAGDWKGRKGRIYYVRVDLNAKRGKVVNTIELPLFHSNTNEPEDIVGDQYEGCLCLEQEDGTVVLVLAERGGSEHYPQGEIKWGKLDLTGKQFSFSASVPLKVDAPGNWIDGSKNRDITDLYVDDENRIWASAAEENGDFGSLYSVIYKLGSITEDPENPVKLEKPFYIHRESYGIKIEALSAPSARSNQSIFSVGFDDEVMGGGWRSIK